MELRLYSHAPPPPLPPPHLSHRCVPVRCSSRGHWTSRMLLMMTGLSLLRVRVASGGYPQDALRCYSSMTEPDGMVICPEARNNYCVKEVVSTPGTLCGKTVYFGDKYEKRRSSCVYRKCESSCKQGRTLFSYLGSEYYRDTYCCQADKCNAAAGLRPSFMILAGLLLVLGFSFR